MQISIFAINSSLLIDASTTFLTMTADIILSNILATITIPLSKPEAASILHPLGNRQLLRQTNADAICTFISDSLESDVWVCNRTVNIHLGAMHILAFTRRMITQYWERVANDGELSMKQINRHIQGHMLCIVYDESGVYMGISRPGKVFFQHSRYLSCRIKKNQLERFPSPIHGW